MTCMSLRVALDGASLPRTKEAIPPGTPCATNLEATTPAAAVASFESADVPHEASPGHFRTAQPTVTVTAAETAALAASQKATPHRDAHAHALHGPHAVGRWASQQVHAYHA
mmetsp:Transcript_18818/g.52747  ORF Transcript_18818/g.52747 Transcript_18818/m.52747 type:complete len:112 (-) Transcript_18818:305-640(-)